MILRMIGLLGLLILMPSAYALDISPLTVGGGSGIATVYVDHTLGQVNVPIAQAQAKVGPKYLALQARVGSSVGSSGHKAGAGAALLTVEFDYFYSLMFKSGLELFDPANTLSFQGGWSKFRMRSTTLGVATRSNQASFGYGVGLRRQLGQRFGISAEYMRYSAAIRATTLNVDMKWGAE